MIYAVVVSTFISTVLILWQLSYWMTKSKRTIQARLEATLSMPEAAAGQPGQVTRGTATSKRRFRLPLMSLPSSVLGHRYMEKLRSDLAKSGLPLKAEELLGLDLLSAAVGFTLGMLILRKPALAIVTGSVGLTLPGLWVQLAKKRRASKVESQLLDSLVLMASALRAGHSFNQALEIVNHELAPPLSQEFGKVLRESRMGLPIEEALTNLVKRVDSKDLELVVTGVLIQRQVGGNLAQVLDNIGDTIGKRIKMRARVRVLTAQGRMSAIIVSALPFFMAAFIFGMYPDFGRIMLENPIGIGMLVGGAIMLWIGIMVIRRVVSVDV